MIPPKKILSLQLVSGTIFKTEVNIDIKVKLTILSKMDTVVKILYLIKPHKIRN